MRKYAKLVVLVALGALALGVRQAALKNLIKFREDFRNKVLSSAKGL